MPERLPGPLGGTSRRGFLQRAASLLAALSASRPAAAAIATTEPPPVDGWERRTIAHFLNTIVPGDDGQPLFPGDRYPLQSGGDVTAGAWSARALDVFYDPFNGVGRRSRQLAAALDLTTRLLGHGSFFHRAGQQPQLEVVDALGRTPARADLRRAAALALAGALGAAVNSSVTDAIGWPGPNGGYFDEGRHPLDRWRQPDRMTADGNLP